MIVLLTFPIWIFVYLLFCLNAADPLIVQLSESQVKRLGKCYAEKSQETLQKQIVNYPGILPACRGRISNPAFTIANTTKLIQKSVKKRFY